MDAQVKPGHDSWMEQVSRPVSFDRFGIQSCLPLYCHPRAWPEGPWWKQHASLSHGCPGQARAWQREVGQHPLKWQQQLTRIHRSIKIAQQPHTTIDAVW